MRPRRGRRAVPERAASSGALRSAQHRTQGNTMQRHHREVAVPPERSRQVATITAGASSCACAAGVLRIAVLGALATASFAAFAPVSYTHLDVYKRQLVGACVKSPWRACRGGIKSA